MPDFDACLARVARVGKIGRGGALALLQEVADRAEEMRKTGNPDPFVTAAAELAKTAKEAARADRLEAVRNAGIRQGILDLVSGFGDAAQTLRDTLHGSNVGSRDNVQSLWQGQASLWQGAMNWALRKAGVEKAALSGEADREVARGMWGKKPSEAKIGSVARQIAETFLKPLEEARSRMNAAGARIGDATDYVMHTWHDPMLMRRGGRDLRNGRMSVDAAFARWWATAEPRLAEKTFEGVDDRARFGRSVFDALVSGIHMMPGGEGGLPADEHGIPFNSMFEPGGGNIARKVSQQRVLFWKDADAWVDYNQQYGRYRTLYEGVFHTLNQGARNTALMEKFGTNPASSLDTLIRHISETYRSDLDGLTKFQRQVPGIQNVMGRLDGSLNIPKNDLWHSLGEAARAEYNMASLGGVGITHFASVWATVPTELRHHGIGALGGLGNVGRVIEGLLRGRGPAEREGILHDLGAYADGYAYNLARNWSEIFAPGQTKMGRLAALQNIFMKTTGIHYIFDNTKAAIRETLSANLGRMRDRGFAELDPHLQQMLGKYGVDAAGWDRLRTAPDLRTWNGRTYITPGDAVKIGDQKLADALTMYFQDGADHGVVAPGVRERAALYGGLRPGTPQYEFARLFMQFKIWPLAAMNQIIGRELHASLSRKDAAWGIGMAVALSATAGYMRMAVNDMATGHPVRDPRDPQTMLAAMAQGGGIGILGDFLFGEVSRMGGGLVATLGGPAAGDADALLRIYGRWRESLRTGQKYNPWPDVAHLAVRHIPFANLVYLKGALDYLMWYHLFEASSPGWWERTNRRLEREQGRTMTGYSPGGGVPWGVPGVFMQNRAGQSFGALAAGR